MTLAPPPPVGPKSRPPSPPRPRPSGAPPPDRHWKEKFIRSGYFLGAVLLHLVIFLMVAAWVVFKPPQAPSSDIIIYHIPPAPVSPPPPPPVHPDQVQLPSNVSPAPSLIVTPAGAHSFSLPPPTPNIDISIAPAPTKPTAPKIHNPAGPSPERLQKILSFITQGQGRSLTDIQESDRNPVNYHGHFIVYLASYADGDWNCNVTMNNGAIQAGSLPDLVAKMNEWSHANMQGTLVPTPLNIAGRDLMDKKPPFIFFAGHKDFHLTDQEVSNLQEYLENGGAIWGDNCLPGSGSRFDVAFHREMKRVIPDRDLQFQKVPMDYPIFNGNFTKITELPTGMNFYREPLEHLDLDGRLAIIYTPNDYSDLFCMRILPGDQAAEGWQPRFGSDSPLFTFGSFGANSSIFFRNFTLPASLKAQRLGLNIVGYLMVRFDKDFLLGP